MAHRATMRRLSQHAAALAAGGAALGVVISNPAASAEPAPSTFHPRWNDGWEAGRYSTAGTGFHRAEPNIHLVTYADKILPVGSAPGARVLVPLCGKTVDMPFMASRGVAVVGLEGASRAVREYFVDSASKPPSTKPIGKFQAHFTDDAPSLELWLGDLFDLEPSSAGKFSAVWDRASLVRQPFLNPAASSAQVWHPVVTVVFVLARAGRNRTEPAREVRADDQGLPLARGQVLALGCGAPPVSRRPAWPAVLDS